MSFFSKTLIFLLIYVSNASAQSLIIDSSLELKKGIYRNFEEFRKNNPSLQITFTIDTIHLRYDPFKGPFSNYALKIFESDNLSKRDSIWGFCDGKNVFVSKSLIYRKNNTYDKMLFLGRYCYYETIDISTGPNTIMTFRNMAVNFNNGRKFILYKVSLKEILQQDPEILNKFNGDIKPINEKLKPFLIEYSLKHLEQVKK